MHGTHTHKMRRGLGCVSHRPCTYNYTEQDEAQEGTRHGPYTRVHIHTCTLYTCLLVYLFIEQDEAQEGTRHGPLAATVLKHNDIHNGGEHLLEHVRMQLQKTQVRGVASGGERNRTFGLLAQVLEEESDNVI